MAKWIIVFVMLAIYSIGLPQETGQQPDLLVLPQIHYGIQWPGGDLANRFGQNFSLGTGGSLLLRSNWMIGLQYGFKFGNQVKEDVLSPLRTPEGLIIGRDKQFANVFLRERGWMFTTHIGYLIPFNPDNNKRSGLLLSVGGGILSHKIRIVDDFDSVVQLSGPSVKGYDRLSRGWGLHQFAGINSLSKNGLINFFAGVEFLEGFTKNRRKYNYDLQQFEHETRKDLLFGLKLGWLFPISLSSQAIYY